MLGETILGPAALSVSGSPGDSGFLYQTPNETAGVLLGYTKGEAFVPGSNLSFVAESSLSGSEKLEYRVAVMQNGSTLVLSKSTP